MQALDHPLGTFLGPHGPGPAQPHLDDEYFAETGRHIIEDFPLWEPSHKILMTNGIPGIENISGDIDKITGKRCTFFASPGAGRKAKAAAPRRRGGRSETGIPFRARVVVVFLVIARNEVTKQSSAWHRLDCFATLAMTFLLSEA